jgi:hypothetical protein
LRSAADSNRAGAAERERVAQHALLRGARLLLLLRVLLLRVLLLRVLLLRDGRLVRAVELAAP